MRTVLVFPACNEPGLEILRALAPSPRFRLVAASGVDPSFDPSRGISDAHTTLPFFGSPEFDAAFDALLEREQVDLIFLTTDALVQWGAERRERDPRYAVPSLDAARICRSKSATYAALEGIVDLPLPWRSLAEGPGFARPDAEGGSRGTFRVEDAETEALARARGLRIDRYLPGPEWTVDALGSLDGALLGAFPRERTAVARGIAVGTRRVERPDLVERVERIQHRLRIAGPFFAQFRADEDGVPRLLEVNARVGGSMGTTRLSGANLPQLAAHLFAGDSVRVPPVMHHLRVQRSLRLEADLDDFDLVVWDLDDTLVHPGNVPDPDQVRWLFELHNRGVEQRLLTRNRHPVDVLHRAGLPIGFFASLTSVDDKLPVLARWFDEGATPERTLLVNDSNREKLAMLDRWPTLRILTPDAITAVAPRPCRPVRSTPPPASPHAAS
jgi:hypothetical protein